MDVVLLDARRLPFRAGCFTRIVTDLPFGRRLGSRKEIHNDLIPKAVPEFGRVLQENGSGAAFTRDRNFYGVARSKRSGLVVGSKLAVKMGGLNIKLFRF